MHWIVQPKVGDIFFSFKKCNSRMVIGSGFIMASLMNSCCLKKKRYPNLQRKSVPKVNLDDTIAHIWRPFLLLTSRKTLFPLPTWRMGNAYTLASGCVNSESSPTRGSLLPEGTTALEEGGPASLCSPITSRWVPAVLRIYEVVQQWQIFCFRRFENGQKWKQRVEYGLLSSNFG